MPFDPRYDRAPVFRGGGGGGNRIADLIMYQGQQAAQADYARGDILGSTIAGVGQQVGEGIQAYQQQKAAKARAEQFQQLFSGDQPPAANDIIKVLGPKDGLEVIKGLSALHPQASYKDRMEQFRDVARGIQAVPEEARPMAYDTAIKSLTAQGILKPGEAPEKYDPNIITQAANYGQAPQKPAGPDVVKPGETLLDPNTHQPLYSAPAAPIKLPAEEAYIKSKYGDTPSPQQMLAGRSEFSAAGRNPSDDAAPTLTGGALDMTAELYAKTGTLPPMGMGKAGATVRQAIINRAAELHPDADIAGNKAGYAADTGSLKTLQQQTDAVSAFESTAEKNSKLLEDAMKRIPDVGVKFLNKPLRSLGGQLGSEDLATFNAIREAVKNEYSRIISSPTLKGTMSDSARKEGDALLSGDLTIGQLRAALKVLKQEAANRHSSYQGQLDQIKGRMGGSSARSKYQIEVLP